MNDIIEEQYVKIKPVESLIADIDGQWHLDNLADFVLAIKSFSEFIRLDSEIVKIPTKSISTTSKSLSLKYILREKIRFSGYLEIGSIKYGSEGWIQILCNAAIISQILLLIKNYIPNGKERMEAKKVKAELFEKRLKILK